jgi:hypothetical protein
MAVVTGVELVKGSSVAGTPGTSVGGVLAPAAADTTDPEATDTPSTDSPSTHVKSSREAGRTADPSASAGPTATRQPPTPSVTPTPTTPPATQAATAG